MPGGGQFSTVSATVQDPSGQIFANGTWLLYFKDTPNSAGPSRNSFPGGTDPFIRIFQGSLDATGSFSQGGVQRNDSVAPLGSVWTLIVYPNTNDNAYQVDLNVTGIAFNASTNINAVIQNIQVSSLPVAHAYKDTEILGIAQPGNIYYDVTKQVLKVFNGLTGTWDIIGSLSSSFVVNNTGLTTAVAPVSFISPPLSPIVLGLWALYIDLMMTQSAASGSIQVVIGWNDGVNSKTSTVINMIATGATPPEQGGLIILFAGAAPTITYSTTFNSITGSPIYNIRIRPIFLG